MNREEMIRRLVSYAVESARREPQSYWLQELFEKGFAGYRRYSDSRLRQELELRGLDDGRDACAEDDLEDYEVGDEADAIPEYVIRGRAAD